MSEFVWPCYRRDAHGPHPVGRDDRECEGVKAHPATQIGGHHGETAPELGVDR